MTPEKAREICVEAHKEQYRKARKLLPEEQENIQKEYSHFDGFEVTKPEGIITWDCKNGWQIQEPYSSHPIAVANMMDTDHEKVIAYLHDVPEDTDYELLAALNNNKNLVYYLVHKEHPIQHELTYDEYVDLGLVTKGPNLSYKENIQHIVDSKRKAPLKVKIADNCHNLSTGTPKQQTKYLGTSLPILIAAI